MDRVPFSRLAAPFREWLFRVVPTGYPGDELLLQMKYFFVERRFATARSDPFTRHLMVKNRDLRRVRNAPLADKLEAKRFADSRGVATVPTLAVLDGDKATSLERTRALIAEHGRLLLKGSAASAENYFVDAGTSEEEFGKALEGCRRDDYYLRSREIAYRGLTSSAFLEPCLQPIDAVRDVKVHLFNGVPLVLQIDSDRFTGHTQSWWTMEEVPRRLSLSVGYDAGTPTDSCGIDRDGMTRLARTVERLTLDEDYVRVDFLCREDELFLGEFTFFPWGMARRIRPAKLNAKLGASMHARPSAGILTKTG